MEIPLAPKPLGTLGLGSVGIAEKNHRTSYVLFFIIKISYIYTV